MPRHPHRRRRPRDLPLHAGAAGAAEREIESAHEPDEALRAGRGRAVRPGRLRHQPERRQSGARPPARVQARRTRTARCCSSAASARWRRRSTRCAPGRSTTSASRSTSARCKAIVERALAQARPPPRRPTRSSARIRRATSAGRADRPDRGDARGLQADRARGRRDRAGAHHRRERHRQGARGARDPRARPRRDAAVRADQLRRDRRDAARVGAVRPRARGVHRRRQRHQGPLRAGARRHGLPRRDRRDVAGAAGEAAAGARGGRGAAGRGERGRSGSTCASSRPPTSTSRRRWPTAGSGRISIYRLERDRHPRAAAARAARRHPAARVDSSSRTRAPRAADRRTRAGRDDGAQRRTTGRATSASSRTPSSAWCCSAGIADRRRDLPPRCRGPRPTCSAASSQDLPSLDELERRYLLHVLENVGGNRTRAAEVMGIDRRTLYRMAERFGIDLEES